MGEVVWCECLIEINKILSPSGLLIARLPSVGGHSRARAESGGRDINVVRSRNSGHGL